MNCIRVTVETADSSQSCLVPVVDDVENLLAEDAVLSALQARVVDLFYLAMGYPARDLLILGDPWAPRNGDGRPGQASVTMPHAGINWLGPRSPVSVDDALCVCGHPYARHNDRAGGGGCHLCRCVRFMVAPAAWSAPDDPDIERCVCGHPRSEHSPVGGLCGGDMCECRLWRPAWTTPGPLPAAVDGDEPDDPDPDADVHRMEHSSSDNELPF